MEQVSMPLWIVLTILTAIGGIIMFILNRAWDTLKDIAVEVKTTNGQVIKLNTEIADHIRHDDERFTRQDKTNDDLWEKLNSHIERRAVK